MVAASTRLFAHATFLGETTMSAAIQSVKETFDFSVDKFPLSGPEGMRTPFYGLFRSDTGKVVHSNSVSKIYVPHQTDDVLALVESAAHAFDDTISARCYFSNGHHVIIEPNQSRRREIFGTTDGVFPRIMIHAGYDGKAFRATLGYWRDICENLAMLDSVSSTRVSIRHTSGLRSQMDDLIKKFEVLKESWESLTDMIVHLESGEVRMADFLEKVYGEPQEDSKRSETRHRNRTTAIFQRLQTERLRANRGEMNESFEVTAWEAFNAVQGYVQHDASRKNKPDTIQRQIMAFNDPVVRRAETLALQMINAA